MEFDAEVKAHTKTLMARGAFLQALSQLLPYVDNSSENHASYVDVHYMAAVCCRYQNRFAQAQEYLNRIKHRAGDTGRVFQEQGHLLRAQQHWQSALVAYQTATQFNPSLHASWQAQVELFQRLGSSAQAEQAQWQVARLQRLPKVLVSVSDLIAQGRLFKAEALCKRFLQQSPKEVEAMRLLADIASQLGALQEAEYLLESACEFAPYNSQVQVDYIQLLRRRQKFELSLTATQKLLARDEQNPQYLSLFAIAKMQTGDFAGAIDYFDRVLSILPHDAVTYTSKGHALKTWGKQDRAIDAYRLALKHRPDHCEAYYSLSNLKTYDFSDKELEAMLGLYRENQLAPNNKIYLDFSLGKAFEDRQQYKQSFEFYANGNKIKRQQSRYDAALMTAELAAQRAFFTRDSFSRLSACGYDDPAPIFIVGLPRAGSTLLEQILSSHSLVDGTSELPNILSLAQRLRREARNKHGSDYPSVLETLSPATLYKFGQEYIEETKMHRQGAPFFIDKMPNNFRHVGLIKTILPQAKIIDARRNPMACCFSGFKQLFAEGQEFSYSLEDIASYYNDYIELMAHWQKIMPGQVLLVNYEEVVSHFEEQVHRLLDFCGLPFESNCLDFHRSKRAVRTASSEQVRQPLYRSGLDQWRNFEPFLDTLRSKLKPLI